MGFIEVFGIVTGAVTVWVAFYTYAARTNSMVTRALIRESDEQTRHLIRALHGENVSLHKDSQAILAQNSRILESIVELLKRDGRGS